MKEREGWKREREREREREKGRERVHARFRETRTGLVAGQFNPGR